MVSDGSSPTRTEAVAGISAELRGLFERAPGMAVVLRGPDHIIEYASPGYLRLMGWREVEGRPLREASPELETQGFLQLLDEVYRTGRPYEGRAIPIHLPAGGTGPLSTGYFDFVYQPIVSASGEVTGIFAQGFDVTDRIRAEQALRASEARFADIFSQVTVGMAQVDLSGRFVLVNDRLCEITGRPREELLTLCMQDITHPDDLPGNRQLFRNLVESGETFVIEKRYLRPDASEVWVRNNVSLQRDDVGRPQYVTAVIIDVTEARLAERRQRLLINELNHRVKNTLATVQSLAAQAARKPDREAAHAAFLERLMALSRAHDVLTREQWEGAELGAIVESAVQPFGADRFVISGPAVRLSPRRTLALAMALHELATNAVKYGSLGREAGRVLIDWRIEGAGPDARLRLEWREEGGPAVGPPDHHGFGTRLLRGVTAELGGTLHKDWDPEGLVCTIDMTLADEALAA